MQGIGLFSSGGVVMCPHLVRAIPFVRSFCIARERYSVDASV